MLLVLIFAALAIISVLVGVLHPRSAEQPMYRIGGICIGLAFAVMAISFWRFMR